jgi:hypothetical protein
MPVVILAIIAADGCPLNPYIQTVRQLVKSML